MEFTDHRSRVAAERRERMRARLLASALQLVAQKGPGALSIDDVIANAGVSRGSFYKYFSSTEVLLQALAVEITNDLIRMAEPIVLHVTDPAERIAIGIRVVSYLALRHPLAATCLARMGWPDARGPNVHLEFVARDLNEGFRRGRFMKMPLALGLNIVSGAVLGAAHSMLAPDCEPDFAESTTAAALRALGLDTKAADEVARRPLRRPEIPAEGLLARTLSHVLAGEDPPA